MRKQHPKEPLNTPVLNKQIIAEASEWLVEFEAGDADGQSRRDFDAWLRQSPEHIRAYLELLPIWKQGAGTRFTRDAGPEALIAYARTEDNIFPLGAGRNETDLPCGAKSSREHRQSPARSKAGRYAAAASLLIVVAGAVFAWLQFSPVIYSTGIGEQHSIVLADGSTLELNAVSKVRTRFTEQQRIVDLMHGQALFRVAKDPARPFIVNIGGTRVRALGTQFDIYKKASGTTVTVIEGSVAVLPPDLLPSGTGKRNEADNPVLTAGEQITVSHQAPFARSKPKSANLASTMAWTQRRLVFDAASLAEVAEEFNRYITRPLVIESPELNNFPISAAFSSTDPASLIRFLQTQPGIQVHEASAEIRISNK